MLRETGVRMPNKLGRALSIVGALVLGQAAVESRFVSAGVVVIVAVAGITGLLVPRLKGAAVLARLLILCATSALGMNGMFFALFAIFLHLLSMSSFGVFYLEGVGAYSSQRHKDIFWRAPF